MVITVKTPIWLDQTLDLALGRGIAAEKLVELAGVLADLGLRQSVISLNKGQVKQQELRLVQKQLQLYGLLNLSACNLDLAEQAGIRQVLLIYSDVGQDNLDLALKQALHAASRQGYQVSLVLEEAGRITVNRLTEIITICAEYPIDAIFYGDSTGKKDPFTVFDQISILKDCLNCSVGIAADNSYGLATANTLAALRAGAEQVITTVGGIGGYAPWEEALMASRQLLGIPVEPPPELAKNCQQIFAMLDLPLAANKAIIGPAIFAHESGLHVDGVNKAPEIYEAFSPELVGLIRRLIVGKHSGTATLRTKFAAWGIALAEEESKLLLAQVRALAVRKKTAVSDEELWRLYLSN